MKIVHIAVFVVAITGASCASWRAVERRDAWTLYARPGTAVDIGRFDHALDPAFVAVEERMGPFESRVDVHALNEGDPNAERATEKLESVPGIGPARVRAFHVRPSWNPFEPSGVFLESADVGSVVHELVHARLADEHVELPLWFEEGLASFYGDGALYKDRWYVDGLCCWPLRELRDEKLGDADLEKLLAVRATDETSSRDNLLVHFIGWAIVFDLARQEPDASWKRWLELWKQDASLGGARARIARTIDDQTQIDWLARLNSPEPGVRFAAAKGTWKLRSASVLELLLDRLDHEDDPDVRLALAVNALIAAGDTRVSGRIWGRVARLVFPELRGAKLESGEEQQAVELVRRSLRGRSSEIDSQHAFDGLARFWDE